MEAFIHSIGINRLKSERAKKLFFVQYNKRFIRKIKRAEYESEAFKWDEGSETTIALGITQPPPPPGPWDTDPLQRTETDSQVRAVRRNCGCKED